MTWHDEFIERVKKAALEGDPESMFHYGTSFGNDSPGTLVEVERKLTKEQLAVERLAQRERT